MCCLSSAPLSSLLFIPVLGGLCYIVLYTLLWLCSVDIPLDSVHAHTEHLNKDLSKALAPCRQFATQSEEGYVYVSVLWPIIVLMAPQFAIFLKFVSVQNAPKFGTYAPLNKTITLTEVLPLTSVGQDFTPGASNYQSQMKRDGASRVPMRRF